MLSFGIKTVPVGTSFEELAELWAEADEVPQIEHAWLWDHFLPLRGPVETPIHEGWTMLAALAARTRRVRLGLMVTGNMTRPPAVLAKMAATVDAISGGRLVLGLGAGVTRQAGDTLGPREFAAYGLPLVPPREGVERLAESCAIITRLWREDHFDFDGQHYRLRDAVLQPKPGTAPPLLIGGWGDRTLRVVAEYADLWNVPGPPHNTLEFLAERSKALDARCAEIGRDPSTIRRSTQLFVDYADPAATRKTIAELAAIGFTHLVLNLVRPAPDRPVRWLAEEIIAQTAQ
ncbi:MAG: LLM class flavin-dependent oxidoreductase [Nonomuraea sp.]|nr:LLM class flavin-dependent oxidoreductase [Nonomuraea sp.]